MAEGSIAEVAVLIVPLSKRLELGFSKGEVHHRENCPELRNSDLALAELVEITEKLLNSNSLHNNFGL